MSSLIVLVAVILGAAILKPVLWRKRDIPDGTTQLPGPKGLPLLGNILSIPPKHWWLKFYEWSKDHGPIYQISMAGSSHVVLSSEKIANELLRERGTIYSSREQLPMAAILVSDSLRPVFLPYNDLWRSGRKLMHHLTTSTIASSYQIVQHQESIRTLRDLIRVPDEYEKWLERYSAGIILRLGFGQKVVTGEEEVVKRILGVVHTLEKVASPGAYLVDLLPSLMYLPSFLAPFKREGRKAHAEELDLFRSLQDDVRKKMISEVAGQSTYQENFTSKYLSSKEKWGLSDDEAAYVIGTLFEAGASTTAAVMMSFILAMVLHPSALLKLQNDIDAVVGDKMPGFEDITKLPRVRAVVKETLRWRPVTAGGIPHKLTKDDTYEHDGKRYFLKEGTVVHPSQWGIHRDATLYPDAEAFLPERWLEPQYPTYKVPLDMHPNIQNFSAFGFGRRICPGQSIAERSLNILVARIAWACDLEQVPGWIPGIYDYNSKLNVQPNKFPFVLKPRKGREMVVDAEYDEIRRHY